MKRLLYLFTLTLSVPVYAAHVTHTDYVSGGTISSSGQNANENAIFNEFNGNIDDTNIAAGAIKLTNLNTEVSAKFVPTGTFFYWVGSTNSIPSGYLYCNGAAISRTTYAALFAVIGTSFGQGDNATTFNLPDTRGYFVRGLNDSSGNDPNSSSRTAATTGGNTGDAIGSVQTSTFTAHGHSVTDPGHDHTYGSSSPSISVDSTGSTRVALYSSDGTGQTTRTRTTGVTINNSGGSETRPININMAGIIKY